MMERINHGGARPGAGSVTCERSVRVRGVRQSKATNPQPARKFTNTTPAARSVVDRNPTSHDGQMITADQAPSHQDTFTAIQPRTKPRRRRRVTLWAIPFSAAGHGAIAAAITLGDPSPPVALAGSVAVLVCSLALIGAEQIHNRQIGTDR